MLLTIDRHGFKIRCDLEPRCLTASDSVRSGYDIRSVVSVFCGTIFKHFSHFNFFIFSNGQQNWLVHLHGIKYVLDVIATQLINFFSIAINKLELPKRKPKLFVFIYRDINDIQCPSAQYAKKGASYFFKATLSAHNITCHAQSLRFYSQQHKTNEGSGCMVV